MTSQNMSSENPNSETLLAIDTAGPRLQLALLTASSADHLVVEITKGHAEIIFGHIATLLARNNISYQDLTRIAVTTGPGSFTGLRIGLSAARGLALGLNIPIIGVPTLLAMSLSAPAGQPVSVLCDARRDEAYIQNFTRPGVPMDKAAILPMDTARASLTPGTTVLEPTFADITLLAQFAISADPQDFPPDPAYIRAADAKPQTKAKIARTQEPAK